MDQSSSRVPTVSDAELVQRVRAGHSTDYAGLVERYERAVLATVLAVVHDAHAAQDIAQDTFVQCYLKLGGLRNPARFGAWLLKVARHQAVRAAKRQKRAEKIGVALTETADRHDGHIFGEEKELLLAQVQKLPRQERLVVSMKYFDGSSVQQMAQMTGSAPGTIRKQLSRAIARLRWRLLRSDHDAR
jgi:RNA polymerase sigma-70 factor, ECF subfamily